MYDEEDDIDDIQDNNTPVGDTTPTADGSTTPAAPVIDHDAIARTVAATVQSMMPAPQQRQMTPEEQAQYYQIWNPDEALVQDMNKLGLDDVPIEQKMAPFTKMRDGIMQQAFRAAQLYIQQELGSLRQELAPAVTFAQQRQAKQLMGEFEKKYPSLKGQNELVDSITSRLNAQGFKPKSKDEAFDMVAKTAESILKGVNPQFTLSQNGGANGMPPMAGTNMGGFAAMGGVQNQGGSAPVKRGGLAPFFQTKS